MLRRALKIIAFPLVVLALFGLLYAVWLALDLPPEETMAQAAEYYLDRYGVVIVLVSAYLEGILVVGWPFPGTLVIVLALVFAAPHPARFALVAAMAERTLQRIRHQFFRRQIWLVSSVLAFGMREPVENAQRRLTRYGLSAIFTTYWQANLASCISTAAGILQFPVSRFLVYSLAAEAMWITFWSSLIFFIGSAALSLVGFRMVLFLIMLGLPCG